MNEVNEIVTHCRALGHPADFFDGPFSPSRRTYSDAAKAIGEVDDHPAGREVGKGANLDDRAGGHVADVFDGVLRMTDAAIKRCGKKSPDAEILRLAVEDYGYKGQPIAGLCIHSPHLELQSIQFPTAVAMQMDTSRLVAPNFPKRLQLLFA